ncbi:dienelactone hydrolase family protein [Pelagicoccus sp. SDUM812005]|uniref:dienelactone hydrolase family protein n=1 Tax=Pelagicoccus sp. SDUM812005 TaxID=3041257 RepID=UPI00280E49DB|nr:dienelactone hydrolase family protein [Pelagicoccus sp. SDUM812005]MDQ8180135.1 dienelactone hydrolase family protein [Pelagicoccus sp. SDUM812005]
MKRKKASDFDQGLLNLFDQYVHGLVDRRFFVKEASKYAIGGLTVAGILDSLSPNYAFARQVDPEDASLLTGYETYESPEGNGEMRGYLVRPKEAGGKLPGVLVVHENRGLNPYVEDVVRRLGKAGYVAFGPDALWPLGGYPGTDDEGRAMQRKLDRGLIVKDFIAGARHLAAHEACNGNIGVVGFCFGGWMSNRLAVHLPDLIKAAVPYYGGQPTAEETAKIKAAIQLHYGGLDERVNAGWPAYEEALKANDVEYEAYIYEGANHGFHNDTTPRFDEAAAALAWERTLAFFAKHLKR